MASAEILSAGGVLALLDEPDVSLQEFALDKLDSIVDEFWAEIAESMDKIEMLYENASFSQRNQAALLAAKIYYHLGEYDESLQFALKAGDCFNMKENSQFVDTIISKCIEQYIDLRSKQHDDPNVFIDARLEQIVEIMFENCLQAGEYKQAIGIAVESRRIDIFEKAINLSKQEMMPYCLHVCMKLIPSRSFRNTVLQILVRLYLNFETPDYIPVCQCLIHLDDVPQTGVMLHRLLSSDSEDDLLMAYQLSFDIYESASQKFILSLRALIKENTSDIADEKLKKVDVILSGRLTIDLQREFLFRKNKTDMLLLTNIKNNAARNSICHSATVLCNAFMHAGTTDHSFLQENLEWLMRASNWAKFSATATLGVIHQGQISESRKILASYLPTENVESAYSEGGSLFALGLIHANQGAEVRDDLFRHLKSPGVEIVHGACLGIGTAAMATGDMEIYEELYKILQCDDAIAGEAAAIAMGLVLLGSAKDKCIEQMIQYAQMTQHEKIIRGIAFGIALIMYGREEEADELIYELCLDKDPILRLSGMHTIAMAYIGTGDKKAILKLLHFAVSDVNDDVRRAAVSSLGFLLFRTPEVCPSMVALLAESYNPHVRYGTAMALGISCAGTGSKEAVALLETLANDVVDFVRQGALIALGMVLVRQADGRSKKTASTRKLFEKVIADKHEDSIAKMGAILGQGIIDAGGRNVTISLASRTGHTSMKTAVGLFLFQQFWYWFPMANFMSLAFTPTALIALNKNLDMPAQDFLSNAKPSTFAYPPMTEPPKEVAKTKVSTAVLSVSTKKNKGKLEKQTSTTPAATESDSTTAASASKETESSAMDVDGESKKEEDTSSKKVTISEDAMEVDSTEDKKEDKKEPSFEMLSNPASMAYGQAKYLEMGTDSRYVPVKPLGGIVMVKDTTPDKEIKLVENLAPKFDAGEEEKQAEVPLPQPFEFEDDE